MRCDTCKYWGNGRGYNEDDERMKSCCAPRFVYGYHVTAEKKLVAMVHAEDDEGWGLRTAPDFGCVCHEPKTPS